MPKSTPYASLPIRFAGLDNRHDPQDVGSHLTIAANVDLLDNSGIRRRSGRTATAVTGAAVHSVWGSGDATFGYVADGDQLYLLDAALSTSLVGTLPSAAEISFTEINDIVACVQQAGISFLASGAFVTFSLPAALDGETQFKALMSAVTGGYCAAHHNGVFLVGTDDGVIFSDQHNPGVHDTRDYLLPTPFPVRFICPVKNGVWVCGSSESAFFAGDTPSTFIYHPHPEIGVLSTAETVEEDWGKDGDETAWAALATDGVYLLTNSGTAIETTGGAYAPPVATSGPGLMRHINGAKQFVACFTYNAEGDSYTDKTMTTDTLEV